MPFKQPIKRLWQDKMERACVGYNWQRLRIPATIERASREVIIARKKEKRFMIDKKVVKSKLLKYNFKFLLEQ